MIFSDDSNSSVSSEIINTNHEKNVKFNLPEMKERRKNKLNSMAEVSESAEND